MTPEQQAKLQELIAEGDELEQQNNIHPVVRLVVHELVGEDGRTWKKEMGDETKALIWAFLDDCKKQRTIGKAVFDLTRLSTTMDHELKAGRIAYELFAMMNDAVVKYDLLNNLDLARIDTDDDKSDVTGSTKAARPAMIGEAPPEGSVKIDKISPKRRI